MSILDNELVKKYFGCPHDRNHHDDCAPGCNAQEEYAFRILKAMEAPVREGERVLYWHGSAVREETTLTDYTGNSPRLFLRLPDQFQPSREKCCEYNKGNCVMRPGGFVEICRDCLKSTTDKPDPVCKHEGLKRFCGEAIYCELCKVDIAKEMAKCTKGIPHAGACSTKPDPVEEKILSLYKSLDELTERQCLDSLHKLVELVRESK